MLSNDSNALEEYKLQQRFNHQISKLARQVQNRLESGLEKHGVTRIQWIALTAIALENKCSPSDLADHIGVSRPAISRLLKQMEAIELIERSLIGDDGRTRQLSLTTKGHESMQACWPHIKDTEQFYLSKLSESEQEALMQILNKLMIGETESFEKI